MRCKLYVFKIIHHTYSFCNVDPCVSYDITRALTQTMEIERCHEDHVATRNPHEYRVLEAASEIWVRRVPCHIGILQCGNTTLVMEEYVPGLCVGIQKEVG